MKRIWIIVFYLCLIYTARGQDTSFVATYQVRTYGDYSPSYTLIYSNGVSRYTHDQEYHSYNHDGSMTVHYPHDFYVWYLDHSTREITEQVYLEDGTLLTANYPADLEWVLLPQFDTIMGLPVQKAEARTSYGEGFMELTLEPAYAWFTTGIPISTGPERHYGLPGLIVKLEYRNAKRFTFTLTDIEFKPFDRPIPIAPDKGIVVNKEEAIRPHTIKQKWLRQQKKLLDSQ